MPTVVALGDTHGEHDGILVPPGDILIHVGDLTRLGELPELERAAAYLRGLP